MELKCYDKNLCYSLSFPFCLILVISFLSGCSDKPKADPELDYPPLYQQIGYSDAQIRYWRETKTNSVMSSDENDSLLVYTHSNQPDVRYLYVFNNHICTTIGISIKTDDQEYFLNKINSFYKEWGFKRLHNEVGSLFGKDNYVSYIEIDQASLTEKNYTLIIFKSNKQVENKNSNYLEYDNFYKLLGETRESIESAFGKCTRTNTIDGQRVEIHDVTKTTFFVFNYRNDKVLRSSVILESTDIKSMKKIIEFIAKKVSNDGYKEIDFSNGVSTVSNGKINIQFKSEPNGEQFRLIFNSFFTDPTVLGTGWSQSNFGDDYTNRLYLSIEDDDVNVVKKYIDEGWDLEAEKGELKQTIFSYACAVGSIQVVKYLISKGVDVNSRNSDIAITPLMYALPSSTSPSEYYAKKLKVFLYLLQQPKVDISYKNSSSKNILDIAMIMEPNNHEIIEAIRKEFESRGKQEINNNLTTNKNNLRVNESNPNKKWGFINKSGQVVKQFEFEEVGSFSDGRVVFRSGEKIGYLDRTGNVIIPPKYDLISDFYDNSSSLEISTFKNGLAIVLQNGLFGIIDTNGREIVKPTYNDMSYPAYCKEPSGGFVDGRMAIRKNKKWGFIDNTGKLIIEPKYDLVSDFSDGIAIVQNGGKYLGEECEQLIGSKYGVIDKTGNLLIPIKYTKIRYNENKILEGYEGGKEILDEFSMEIKYKQGKWIKLNLNK